MRVRAEQLRAFHANGPIAESGALGGTGDNADVLKHGCFDTNRVHVDEVSSRNASTGDTFANRLVWEQTTVETVDSRMGGVSAIKRVMS